MDHQSARDTDTLKLFGSEGFDIVLIALAIIGDAVEVKGNRRFVADGLDTVHGVASKANDVTGLQHLLTNWGDGFGIVGCLLPKAVFFLSAD